MKSKEAHSQESNSPKWCLYSRLMSLQKQYTCLKEGVIQRSPEPAIPWWNPSQEKTLRKEPFCNQSRKCRLQECNWKSMKLPFLGQPLELKKGVQNCFTKTYTLHPRKSSIKSRSYDKFFQLDSVGDGPQATKWHTKMTYRTHQRWTCTVTVILWILKVHNIHIDGMKRCRSIKSGSPYRIFCISYI